MARTAIVILRLAWQQQRTTSLVPLIGLLLATVSPETLAQTTTDSPRAEVRVALPNDHNLQWMNFWVALGAGHFADEGISISTFAEWSGDNAGGRGAIRALLDGEADIAVLPRPLFLIAASQAQPVIAFANLLQNDPINLVLHRDVADTLGLSTDLPLAERLSGLRGLRIGVAPGPVSRLRALMTHAGLDAETDIEVMIVPGELQNQYFSEHRIDALYAHTPYLERALTQQDSVMLVNQSAGEVPKLSNRQIHLLVTTQGFRNKHPEVLHAVTRAIVRAQTLIRTDAAATLAAIHESDIRLQEPEALELIAAIYAKAVPDTPEVTVEGAIQELSLFPNRRQTPDMSAVEMSDFVDNSFARQAVTSEEQ